MANPVLENGTGSPQSIFTSSSSAAHTLGTRGRLGDQIFYYAKASAGAAMTIGEVQVSAAIVANHQNLATATTCLSVGSNIASDVTLGATAAAADLYAQGFLAVTDAGGQGQMFRIREHDAIASAGTGDFVLYDEAAIASDASTTVSLIKNLYDSPQQSNTTVAEVAVGVPRNTVDAGEYGWVQTQGACPCLNEMTTTAAAIGANVTISPSTAGAVEGIVAGAAETTGVVLGQMITTGVDTEYQVVYLNIRS